MNLKSQIRRITSRMLQMVFLIGLFVGGGFLLPMYTAPTILSALSITPVSEYSQSQISISITNRNIASMGEVQFTASNPEGPAHVTAVRYSCGIDNVSMLYPTAKSTYKKLPCGTDVYVPKDRSHTLQVRTNRTDIAYVPITVRVDSGDRTDEVSSVIAASSFSPGDESALSDRVQVTLDEFGMSR